MITLNVFHLGLLLIIAYTIIGHCSSQTIETDDETVIEKRPAFFVGSRYGRSIGQTNNFRNGNKFGRAMRGPLQGFNVGSRYGKRSSDVISKLESLSDSDIENKFSNGYYMMSCIYTGVKNFYRCAETDSQQYR